MFVAKQINRLESITNSEEVQLNGQNYLFLTEGNAIRVYELVQDKYELRGSKYLQHRVLAWSKFVYKSRSVFVFIDAAYKIQAFDVSRTVTPTEGSAATAAMLVVTDLLTELSREGQQQSSTFVKPLIQPSSPIDPDYILLQVFHSNVQMISVSAIMEQMQMLSLSRGCNGEGKSPRLKPLPVLSAPLGNFDVLQLVIMDTSPAGSKRKRKSSDLDSNSDSDLDLDLEIAILCKDVFASVSFRWLQFDSGSETFQITKQSPPFDEDPSLIVPWSSRRGGGLMAFTSSSLFYFPSVSISNLSLARSLKEVFILSKKSGTCLVMTLSKPGRGKSKVIYRSYLQIDDLRLLLVTSQGNCYMLYVDFEMSSRDSMVVNQMNFIDLGPLTVPSKGMGLHHVRGNIFFQSSEASKSVLFEILPTKPNINILSSIDSSPPVVDIGEGSTRQHIYTCQGCWDGSELRRYDEIPRAFYKTKNSVQYPARNLKSFEELKGQGHGHVRYLFKISDFFHQSSDLSAPVFFTLDEQLQLEPFDADAKDTADPVDTTEVVQQVEDDDSRKITLTETMLRVDQKTCFEFKKNLIGRIVPEYHLVLTVTDDQEIVLLDYSRAGSKTSICIKSSGSDVISSADVCKNGHATWVFAVFLSGNMKIWRVNDSFSVPRVVYDDSPIKDLAPVVSAAIVTRPAQHSSSSDKYSSASKRHPKLLLDVFLSCAGSGGGTIKQLLFESPSDRKLNLLSVESSKLDPRDATTFQIKKRGDRVVMFNTNNIVIPTAPRGVSHYGLSIVRKCGVSDIVFMGGNSAPDFRKEKEIGRLLVIFESGLVEEAEVSFGMTPQRYPSASLHSNKLFTKCALLPEYIFPTPGERYLVALAYDKSSTQGEMRSELVLVSLPDFKVVDVFKFNDSTVVVDLCMLPRDFVLHHTSDEGAQFVALSSWDKSPLAMFRIRDSKIKLVERCAVENLKMTKEVRFQNILVAAERDMGDSNETVKMCPFILSGSVLMKICLSYEEQRHRWQLMFEKHAAVPCFAADAAWATPDGAIIADAVEGICRYDAHTFQKNKLDSSLPYEPCRPLSTCVSVSGAEPQYIISGDTSGTVHFSQSQHFPTKEGIFKIGWTQINVVTSVDSGTDFAHDLALVGTVSGALFLISEITDPEFEAKVRKAIVWVKRFVQRENLPSIEEVLVTEEEDDEEAGEVAEVVAGAMTKSRQTRIIDTRSIDLYLQNYAEHPQDESTPIEDLATLYKLAS
ncbi:uncharacterized protein LODBEIA_P35410 [Lodderomyces beijingensis]|uniref:Cleavage/polyadenylation specificity factor A subunit N-terminal domain-containing protein n=1 Tax=Lodderomyces beijingensis TaxID=1775926 RepID=A0ABP0ZSR8_9ASCO